MLDIRPLERMMKMRGRVLWVALLVAFEVCAFWYFLLHAPSGEGHAQNAQLKRRSSPANMRRCLSPRGRDPRFVRRNACVTPTQRMAALEDLLFELTRVFETVGIDYWLDSGSLLGQHRTGGVIPWDVNGNVGVLQSGLQRLRDANIDLPDGYELNIMQSKLYQQADRFPEIPARWVERTHGFYVDIFEFQTLESWNEYGNATIELLSPLPDPVWNTCWHCEPIEVTRTNGKETRVEQAKRFRIPRDWVFPLRTCQLESFQVKCPAQPVPYLTHLYGEDFLEPVLW
ncbi:hypothetical protein Gpo141_00001918 [Globisporangium polare]